MQTVDQKETKQKRTNQISNGIDYNKKEHNRKEQKDQERSEKGQIRIDNEQMTIEETYQKNREKEI